MNKELAALIFVAIIAIVIYYGLWLLIIAGPAIVYYQYKNRNY